MASVVRMPEVLAGATEAVLSTWSVAEGAEVAVGDVLAEIETEKATVEYQAEEAGTLARFLIKPGDSADVGTPIAIFTAPGDGDAEISRALANAGVNSAAGEAAPAPVAVTPSPSIAEPPVSLVVDEQPAPTPSASRLFASPLVRRLAREAGIDLTTIQGTGPGGRIVRKDFEAHRASSLVSPAAPQNLSGYVEVPHTGMRKAIARRLSESKSTVPHFYLSADCRVDRLVQVRSEVNAAKGVKYSLNDWVVKAVAMALMEVPDANVIWGDTAMRRFDSADISVAVATEGGLFTPVIRGVESMSLGAVNTAIAEAAGRARSGTIKQEEIEGGSFAVTNLGMYGTTEFAAIINPPQWGILAVGAATQRPVVENGSLAVGSVMTVTLSADHRAVDGALAAQWLAAFQRHIENPVGLLL
ncbi:MAG: dihydrolipoamide acetyltransferase family protein [Pontimonas sp.]|jgi:pyruvate dehydrogenase E2 component (dihydrolipoamide acetyltransferase)